MIPPIVDVDWLKNHPEAVLADVRWYLDGRSGAQAYASGHLPGAVFLDIDTDLSAPPSAEGGRHPLPDPEDFASAMVDAGISDDSVVVAYDDFGGFSAGRLVWMLRSLGVDAALLDGGIDAWDGPLSTEEPEETDEDVTFGIRGWGPDVIASIDEAVAGPMVIDARTAQRYRGERPFIDTFPGHIPGALSAPVLDNLGPDKRFRPVDELKDRFAAWTLKLLQLHASTDALLLGRYPLALRLLGIDRSAIQPGDLATIAQPLDFFGVNFYNPQYVRAAAAGSVAPLEEADPPAGFERTEMGWPVIPEGLTELLLYLKRRYGAKLPPIVITENGCALADRVGEDGTVDDRRRIAYIDGHLRALRQAMDAGVDVRGYFVWSLLDNFEWAEGYRPRFGLVHVDFASQERTPKASYHWYRELIAAQR